MRQESYSRAGSCWKPPVLPDAMDLRRSSNEVYQKHTSDDERSWREENKMRWSAGQEGEGEAWNVDGKNGFRGRLNPLPTNRTSLTSGRWPKRSTSTIGALGWLMIISVWILPVSAAFISFENCLSDDYKTNSSPSLKLQFVPLFLNAVFNAEDPNHNLNVTVYGNVNGTGPTDLVAEPSANNTDYWNSNSTALGGKIENQPNDGTSLTTLFSKVNVLTYEPYNSGSENFCASLINTGNNSHACPLGQAINANLSNPYELPAFGFAHNFYSTYAFASFTATIIVQNGDDQATPIACISAEITPDLGRRLSHVLTYVPLVVLVCVGIATALAAVYSPWGSTDIFRWTTNYGRDADLLRLVTPGFGDCLQYLQFIALTGGLTLDYPGFYQPIVSKVAWSSLMFNQSFISGGNGANSLVDGIYATDGLYGMDVFRQLVGMSAVDDVWAGTAVWLLVIIGAVLAIIEAGFLLRWISRVVKKSHEQDLRAKNMPFAMGNVIRIVFNYFLLPAVALSMFQLVVATESPVYTVALAVVMLVLILGFAVWLLYFIASTKPRSFLFDDLPTVLLYGSLYNTYSDNAAPFALVPVLLTFVRGIAIGAVQPSGVAQLVILAICEVITVLTLHAFRPFHSPTSMNAFHTIFSILRGTTVLLMVAFAPSLGVTEGPKGWVGYAILLIHAVVLIIGFLLNAFQTIVEVGARLAGAGGDESGAARGGLSKVFGMRQLSRRLPRSNAASRQSQLSTAGMLDADRKAYVMDNGRFRSQSAGSQAILLNRQSTGGFDNGSVDPYGAIAPHQLVNRASTYTPTTPGDSSTFSFAPAPAAASGPRDRSDSAADPYYRPPRYRRPTLENNSPGGGSWMSGDPAHRVMSQEDSGHIDRADTFEGPSISGRVTPVQQMALEANGSPTDPRRSKADYTTRESDFYYGVRGPALNANIPSRRTKTGPTDPTGSAASALGWVKGLFGGKTKEKGKGFEVVRSARMPPGMRAPNAPPEAGLAEGLTVVGIEGGRNGPIDSDDEHDNPPQRQVSPMRSGPSHTGDGHESASLVSPMGSDDEYSGDEDFEVSRISDIPPMLPGIEIGQDGIELPSRFPSKATSRADSGKVRQDPPGDVPLVPGLHARIPSVPRKSSRRKSQNTSVDLTFPGSGFQHRSQGSNVSSMHHSPQRSTDATRLPFEHTNTGKAASTISAKSSVGITPDSSREISALGNYSIKFHESERPTSMGFVHHHPIHTVTPGDNPEYLGSSAEVVDGRSSGGSSIHNMNHAF